jgi:hypothetical protein
LNKQSFLDFAIYVSVGLLACWLVDITLAMLCFVVNIFPTKLWFPENRTVIYGISSGIIFLLLERAEVRKLLPASKSKLLLSILALGLISYIIVGVMARIDYIPMFEFKKN